MNSISSFNGVNTRINNKKPIIINGINLNYAGNGNPGNSGDGGAAAAQLGKPAGVACDICMNLYITDWDYGTIRKVDASTGNISTIVGNGIQNISVITPAGIAVDNSFNVYFANFNNGSAAKIYRIDKQGTITNIYNGYRVLGITLDYSGTLYFSDNNSDYFKMLNPSSATLGTAVTKILALGDGYVQSLAINTILQLFIINPTVNNSFGYYNINGGTYLTSSFNSLKPFINNETAAGIAINPNDIVYVITLSNNLYISPNSSYNSNFIKFSKNSNLSLSLNNYTYNPCFDICNNFYIPNTAKNSVIKVTNITT